MIMEKKFYLLNIEFQHKYLNGEGNYEITAYYEHKNGIKSWKSSACNFMPCGLFQKFYDTGELKIETNYDKEGKKIGKEIYYLKNASICAIFLYENGKIASGTTGSGRKMNNAEIENWTSLQKANCE